MRHTESARNRLPECFLPTSATDLCYHNFAQDSRASKAKEEDACSLVLWLCRRPPITLQSCSNNVLCQQLEPRGIVMPCVLDLFSDIPDKLACEGDEHPCVTPRFLQLQVHKNIEIRRERPAQTCIMRASRRLCHDRVDYAVDYARVPY